MNTRDVRVTIRVDRELKESAEELFNYLGLNMSNAVNIFLRKAVDQKGIPFQIKSEEKRRIGLSPEKVTRLFNYAVKKDIERKIKKRLSIARYDIKSGRAYLENADGTREYV